MRRKAKSVTTFIGVLAFSLFTGIAAAQKEQVEQAPIPTQIASAKRLFIANGGGDEPGFQDPLFDGGLNRAYNQFYAAMKGVGRHELVGAPAEADLLFEIRFTVHSAECTVMQGTSIGNASDPQFRLEIRDPKTNALLWAFSEHMEWAILKGNRNRNYDQALARIVADVQDLITRATANASGAKP